RDPLNCYLQYILIQQVHCIPAQPFLHPDGGETTVLTPPVSLQIRLLFLLPVLEIHVGPRLLPLAPPARADEKLSPHPDHLSVCLSPYPLYLSEARVLSSPHYIIVFSFSYHRIFQFPLFEPEPCMQLHPPYHSRFLARRVFLIHFLLLNRLRLALNHE